MAIRTGVIHNRQRHHQVGVFQIGGGHRLAVGDQVYVEARHEQRHAQISEGGGRHVHWLGVAGDEERPALRPGGHPQLRGIPPRLQDGGQGHVGHLLQHVAHLARQFRRVVGVVDVSRVVDRAQAHHLLIIFVDQVGVGHAKAGEPGVV